MTLSRAWQEAKKEMRAAAFSSSVHGGRERERGGERERESERASERAIDCGVAIAFPLTPLVLQ